MTQCSQRPASNRRIVVLLYACLGLIAALLAGCGGSSSKTNLKNIDTTRAAAIVADYMAAGKPSAISVAVVREGRLLWTRAAGTANKSLNLPATENTVFSIASISKTVVAVAAMQLVEEGKLNLDADINSYLPFMVSNPKVSGTITVRHLLTHTAGISDNFYADRFLQNEPSPVFYYYKDTDPALSLSDFCRAFFVSGGSLYNEATFRADPPGSSFEYSNTGIALAAYVVEAISGEPFYAFTKRRIFQPLGMNRSSWRVSEFTVSDMAMPYGPDGTPFGNYSFADYPSGNLRTTATDLSRFLRAFMLGGSLEGARILKPESVAEIRRVQYPNVLYGESQGLSWDYFPSESVNALGHAGAERGITTGMWFNVATNSGVIFLTNGELEGDEVASAQVALVKGLLEEADKL